MLDLPFIVVWSRPLGVALILALFVGALWLARRLDRVRLRSALRERRPAEAPARRASELVEGESITLAGKLEVEGEPAASLEDGSPAAASSGVEAFGRIGAAARAEPDRGTQASALCVRLDDGERVRVEGPVRVVVGSRAALEFWGRNVPGDVRARLEAARALRAPSAGEARAARVLPRTLLQSVAAGDEVAIGGVARKVAGDGVEDTYRGSPTAWAIVPSSRSPAMPIHALGPLRATVARGSLGRYLAPRAPLAVAVALALSWTLGEATLGSTRELAALSPFHRTRALREYRAGLERGTRRVGRERLVPLLAVSGMLGDCEAEVRALHEHGQWDEVVRRADACVAAEGPLEGVRLLPATALVLSGKFEEASDRVARATRFEPSLASWVTSVHLAARKYGRAAEALARRPVVPLPTARKDHACLVAALLSRESGKDAPRARVAEESSARCVVLSADRLSGAARVEYLEEFGKLNEHTVQGQVLPRLRMLLAVEAGAPAVRWGTPTFLGPKGDPPSYLLAGHGRGNEANSVAAGLLDRLASIGTPTDDQRAMRSNLAAHQAVFELGAQNAAEASRWAELAERDAEAFRANAPRPATEHAPAVIGERLRAALQLRALRVLAALSAGDLPGARALFEPWRGRSERFFLDQVPAAETYAKEYAEELSRGRTPVSAEASASFVATGTERYAGLLRTYREGVVKECTTVIAALGDLLDVFGDAPPSRVSAFPVSERQRFRDDHKLKDYDSDWTPAAFSPEGLAKHLASRAERPCFGTSYSVLGARLDPQAVAAWAAYAQCERSDAVGSRRLIELGKLALVARRAGDAEAESRHRATQSRFREALFDRDTAVLRAVLWSLE